MNKLYLIFLITSLFTISLSADCTQNETPKQLAYQQFLEAEDMYDQGLYNDAYTQLLQSKETFPTQDKTLILEYTCVNYIPGPYAPIIKKTYKTEEFSFNRFQLGRNIKEQLSPAPYVLIEFQKNATIVSVINSSKISRNKDIKRLPLENFSVTIEQELFTLGKVESGVLKSASSSKTFTHNSAISTDEDFGFKLYK